MALNSNALTTLAQAKSQLAIPGVTEDARVEMFINAASARIERFCDRRFKQASYSEYHHGRGQNLLLPLEYPIISIAEIRVSDDKVWTEGLVPSTDYFIVDYDQAIQYLGYFPSGFGNIRLMYSAGYATIPSDLEMACLWYVEWYFKHRDRGDMGRTSISKGDESVGVLDASPKMIQEILLDYKRTEIPSAAAPIRIA